MTIGQGGVTGGTVEGQEERREGFPGGPRTVPWRYGLCAGVFAALQATPGSVGVECSRVWALGLPHPRGCLYLFFGYQSLRKRL